MPLHSIVRHGSNPSPVVATTFFDGALGTSLPAKAALVAVICWTGLRRQAA